MLNYISAKMQKICDSRSDEISEQKWKVSEKFLTNSHTEKCQKHMKKMTEIKKKLEYYKNNNQQTRIIILKKLWVMSTYQQADESEKRIMKDQAKNDVMQQW